MSDTLNSHSSQIDSTEQQDTQNLFGVDALRQLQAPTQPTKDFGVDYTKTSKIPDTNFGARVKIDFARQIESSNQELQKEFFDQQTNVVNGVGDILSQNGIVAPNNTQPRLESSLQLSNGDRSVRVNNPNDYKIIGISKENFDKIQKYNTDLNDYYNGKIKNYPILPKDLQIDYKKYNEYFQKRDDIVKDLFPQNPNLPLGPLSLKQGESWEDISKKIQSGEIKIPEIRQKFVDHINGLGTIEEKLAFANMLLDKFGTLYPPEYYNQFNDFNVGKATGSDALNKFMTPEEFRSNLFSGKNVGVCRDAHVEVRDILAQAGLEAYSASVVEKLPHVITMVKDKDSVYMLDWGTSMKFKNFKEAFTYFEQKNGLIQSSGHFVYGAGDKLTEIVKTPQGEKLNEIVRGDFMTQLQGEIVVDGKSQQFQMGFDKDGKMISMESLNGKRKFDASAIMASTNGTQFLTGKLGTEYSINDAIAVFAQLTIGKMKTTNEYTTLSKDLLVGGLNAGIRGNWKILSKKTDSGQIDISGQAGARITADAQTDADIKNLKGIDPKKVSFGGSAFLQAGGNINIDYNSNNGKLKVNTDMGYMADVYPARGARQAFFKGIVVDHQFTGSVDATYRPDDSTTLTAKASGVYNSAAPDTYTAGVGVNKTLGNGLGLEGQLSGGTTISKLDGTQQFANVQGGASYQVNNNLNIAGGAGADMNWKEGGRTIDPYIWARANYLANTGQTVVLNGKISKTGGSIGGTFTLPGK